MGLFTDLAQVPSTRGRVREGADFWLNLESNKSHFWSNLEFDSQPTSNRHDLVLLDKYAQLTKIHFQPKRTLKPN